MVQKYCQTLQTTDGRFPQYNAMSIMCKIKTYLSQIGGSVRLCQITLEYTVLVNQCEQTHNT